MTFKVFTKNYIVLIGDLYILNGVLTIPTAKDDWDECLDFIKIVDDTIRYCAT